MFTYTAFNGFQIISQGALCDVAVVTFKKWRAQPEAKILIFSDSTGRQMDLDLSGSEKDVIERLKMYETKPTTPHVRAGRPKLGVIPREISLLPHHWEWLLNQDGGSSSAIRRLIDEKTKPLPLAKDKIKQAQEVTYKFLSAIAGDLPHFEEVTRYLYRKDKKKFESLMADWPKDITRHTLALAAEVFK